MGEINKTKKGMLELYGFEKKYNHSSWTSVLDKHYEWSIYLSLIYALLVQVGQRWMAKRPPINFGKAIIAWNFALVVFSVVVGVRMMPELWTQWMKYGFMDTLCRFGDQKKITELWGVVFAFSKIIEWGDTAFLVFTKKPIQFLHWYHHATVAMYGFYVGDINDPASRWFVVINSFIHTIMYAYYGLKALKVYIPRQVSVVITSMQITQMVFGIYVSAITSFWKVAGKPCGRSSQNIHVAGIMYMSYLILFGHFFKRAYLSGKPAPATPKRVLVSPARVVFGRRKPRVKYD